MIEITIDATDALQKINAIDATVIARAIADEIDVTLLQPALRMAPPARRKRQPFVSAQQRKAFFAKLRGGQIQVPYVRSGRATTIGNWPATQDSDGLTRTGTFPYADLLRGTGQAAYHRGNWADLDQMAQQVEGAAEVPATAALLTVLEKAGLT